MSHSRSVFSSFSKIAALTLGIIMLAENSAWSATLTVKADGSMEHAAISQAIAAAAPGDIIEVWGTITETGIVLDKNLTIQGRGIDETVVQGAASPEAAGGRVFSVNAGVTARISHMTIRHGNVLDHEGYGGAILNQGVLTISHCAISRNSQKRGAITNRPAAVMEMERCVVSHNSATDWGGGIYNYNGTMSIWDSEISSNTAGNASGIYSLGSGSGQVALLSISRSTVSGNTTPGRGALCNYGDNYGTASLTLNHSTVSGNTSASDSAGGIYNVGEEQGTAISMLTNCTLSGNRSAEYGGGAENIAFGNGRASLTLTHCTVADNVADSDNDDPEHRGGGIYTQDANTILLNSIVANNRKAGGSLGDDLGGYVPGANVIANHSLIGFLSDITLAGANNITGERPDLALGPLADNGGPTRTHGLQSLSSPAINAGSVTAAPPADQRGYARDDSPDMGAFEYEGALPRPVLETAKTTPDGTQIEMTFSKAMADPGGKHAQFVISNGGAANPPTAAALKDGDEKTILLTPDIPVKYGEALTVSHAEGDIMAGDGTVLAPFHSEAVLNMTEPEPVVTLSLSSDAFSENRGTARVIATLSAVSERPVSVSLAFGGDAVRDEDYSVAGDLILIPAGSPSADITLTGTDDALDEAAESVIVDVVSVTNGEASDIRQMIAMITDDDSKPDVTLTLSEHSFAEDGGTASLIISLSAPSAQDVAVELAFTGTATLDTDYTVSESAVTIPPGTLSASIALTAKADDLDESDETILADIIAVSNAAASDARQVIAEITDDDPLPEIWFDSAEQAGDEDIGEMTVSVRISQVSGRDVFAPFHLSGTASADTDYAFEEEPVGITVPRGAVTGNVTIRISDDTLAEPDETLILTMESPENATLSSPSVHTLILTDKEPTGWHINEIHADPDPLGGDANGDGHVSDMDEFVEILNHSGDDADISGWTLSDSAGVRHTFPAGTLVADRCAVVVFGGGNPAGLFGNVAVQTSGTGSLDLDDGGDTITLTDSASGVRAVYAYGPEGGNDQSLTRDPYLSGTDALVAHASATGSGGALFSPGTAADARIFAGCNTAPESAGIPDVSGSEDADDTSIDLWPLFSDAEDADAGLRFAIRGNTESRLFASADIVSGEYLMLDYAADANGSSEMTIRATDSSGLFVETRFTVTVSPVNDPPSFAKGPDQHVSEDAGAQIVSFWANSVSQGPADEFGQGLEFEVENDHPELFDIQPGIDSEGTLTYTPAANAYGSATVSVRLRDDGGTAGGGADTSDAQTFTITISGVDDPPVVATPIEDITLKGSSSTTIALDRVFSDTDSDASAIVKTVHSNSNPELVSASITGDRLTLASENQSGTAAIVIRGTSDGKFAESAFTVTVEALGNPPGISGIADQNMDDRAATGPILFLVMDAETPADQLAVSADSSNTALVSEDGVVLGGAGSERTVSIRPVPNMAGESLITLTVADEHGNTATSAFTVSVTKGANIGDCLMSVALQDDLGGDGDASPGDALRYTTLISNTGDREAAGVMFVNAAPAGTAIIPGSLSADSGTLLSENPVSVINIGIPADGAVGIVFDVRIDSDIQPETLISNQGIIAYDSDGDENQEASWRTDGDPELPGHQPTDILTEARQVEQHRPGDIDGSGSVDLADAVIGLRIVAEMDISDNPVHIEADVNKDNKIGLEEVIFILLKMGNERSEK